MISNQYDEIVENVLSKFSHKILDHYFVKSPSGRVKKIRFELINFSIIDIYYSKYSGKYSFHYDCETEFYRHDNSPHHESVKTFPKHCHHNEIISESFLSDDIVLAAVEFFEIVSKKFFN